MSRLELSDRVLETSASPIRGLVNLAKEQEKKGVKVLYFNIGQPDLATPKRFFEEVAAYNKPVVPYAPSQGHREVQEAWCEYFRSIGLDISPDETIVTQGGVEALFLAQAALMDPGDELLLFEPSYPTYQTQAKMLGIKVVPISLKLENGFHLPPMEELQKKITPKTKAIIVCNPSNPTGTVFTPEEVNKLAEFAKKNGIFIIADEVYREYAFERKAVSMMTIPSVRDNVVLVDTVSKRFNLCGARVGVLASHNRDFMREVLKLAQARESVATLEQLAVVPILKDAEKYFKSSIEEYRKRREAIYQELMSIPEIKVSKPEGAFYVMVGLPFKDAQHFATWMLTDFRHENQTLCVAPAAGFYASKGKGMNEIRLAYVVDVPTIRKGVQILRSAIKTYMDAHKEMVLKK